MISYTRYCDCWFACSERKRDNPIGDSVIVLSHLLFTIMTPASRFFGNYKFWCDRVSNVIQQRFNKRSMFFTSRVFIKAFGSILDYMCALHDKYPFSDYLWTFEYQNQLSKLWETSIEIEFYLKVFTDIQWIQWQNICHYSKRAETCHPTTSHIRNRDATTAPARHIWETGSLNWAQCMLQWFISFPEFAEFSDFLFYLRKTLMFYFDALKLQWCRMCPNFAWRRH